MKELLSLVDYSVASPGPTIDEALFPNTPALFFWSATVPVGSPSSAWLVHFGDTSAIWCAASGVTYVRCVR